MPRKIRELKADLRKAGDNQIPGRGKGSHTWWEHPKVPAYAVDPSGHDGDDAKPYQEKAVHEARARPKGEVTHMTTESPAEIHYAMVIEWSDEDQVFLVTLPEWADRVNTPTTHGATYEEAMRNGQEALQDLLAITRERGEAAPAPRIHVGA